jgi:hypothetical protein
MVTQHYEEEEIFYTVCGCEDPYCIKPVQESYHKDVEKDFPIISKECLTDVYGPLFLREEINPLVG